MKANCFAVVGFCMLLTACKQQTDAKKSIRFGPLQNGFGVVVQPMGIDSGPGAKLFFKGTNETPVQVWPHIGTSGYPILYTNDVALLMAAKPDEEGRLGGSALIVVQGVGPAMDISNDVLRLYALSTNANFNTLLRYYRPLRLIQSEGKISVTYVGDMTPGIPPDLEFATTWEQIFSIMDDVKRTGRTNKVTKTDVLYLEKDYGHIK